MNAETDTLGRPVVKVSVADLMAMTQAKMKAETEQKPSVSDWLLPLGKGLCWLGFLVCLVTSLGLSILRWSANFQAESVLLSWLWVGMVMSLLGAIGLRSSINQQKIKDGLSELTIGVGELATQVQAFGMATRRASEAVAERMERLEVVVQKLLADDALVDELSEQVDTSGVNGRNVTRLIRPARPQHDDWHR